ncbi:MAG: sigma-70 family RNA polymerase sigma factor [Planctomycetota bacterium]
MAAREHDVTDTPELDPSRYDDLFARNLPALAAYVQARIGAGLAARESVSDLTQSVCREVLSDLDQLSFASDEAFRSFLFLQASRKIVDRSRFHRMGKRDQARELRMPTVAECREPLRELVGGATPSRVVEAREEFERIERAITELPDAQREAVLLHRLANVSYLQIAERMGLTEAAVRGLVARGLARLAGLLRLR